MNDDLGDPLAEFRRVNVDGALRLARLVAEVGVWRFVFLSSNKVNGGGARSLTIHLRPINFSAW